MYVFNDAKRGKNSLSGGNSFMGNIFRGNQMCKFKFKGENSLSSSKKRENVK